MAGRAELGRAKVSRGARQEAPRPPRGGAAARAVHETAPNSDRRTHVNLLSGRGEPRVWAQSIP